MEQNNLIDAGDEYVDQILWSLGELLFLDPEDLQTALRAHPTIDHQYVIRKLELAKSNYMEAQEMLQKFLARGDAPVGIHEVEFEVEILKATLKWIDWKFFNNFE